MRRIVLIDSEETSNYVQYFGCGLGDEIYSLQYLSTIDDESRRQVLSVGPGDAVLLVGSEPFRYFQNYYHFGVRSENYFDCSKLPRLSISSGAFVKVQLEFPTDDEIRFFMSPGFTTPVTYNFKWKVIKTCEEALNFFKYLSSLPSNQDFGFDYETSGMPMEIQFWVSGFAICTELYGGFVSLTDLKHEGNPEAFDSVMFAFKNFLEARQKHIWTFNVGFEYQVSHRLVGSDLFELSDASVVNILDGFHEKNYSLKWTAQRVLGVDVWDTEFDLLSDLIERMLFKTVGKLKREQHQVIKVDKDNFTKTDEWKEIVGRYPNYAQEFHDLILEFWGNQYMPIPSDILGKYCCLDSFYTLQIYRVKRNEYSEEAFNTFLDNLRLGARLMTHGHYIDEPFRQRYANYCEKMMAWSSTWCARAWCWLKMEKHRVQAADINKYEPSAVKLIEEGRFHNGKIIEILKDLLPDFIDHSDLYNNGFDEGKFLLKFGEPFASEFVSALDDSMKEVKLTKIDDGVVRKKKLLGILGEKLIPILGIDKIKFDKNGLIGKKHIELEKYMYYSRIYKELEKINKKQLVDINNIPDKIYLFGKLYTVKDYADEVTKLYFPCLSPEKNDEIIYDMMMNKNYSFRAKTSFLGAMQESTQQLPETTKFYIDRGIKDIDTGFAEMMKDWELYATKGIRSNLYPDKVFDIALELYQSPKTSSKQTAKGKSTIYQTADKVKEVWTDFLGFNTQTQFFPDYALDYKNYESVFDPRDLINEFYFMRKFTINYLMLKKHAKMLSTYVGEDGMFKKKAKWVIEDSRHIPIRDAVEGEPGAVWKNFTTYEVLKKSSKRWSSPFHTIISHGDCKDCLIPPPILDKYGNTIYGASDQLLSYFDISSAEVKSAGYASGDLSLIELFNNGIDVYIDTAIKHFGEEVWNSFSDKEKGKKRKAFKQIYLGILYGLGKQNLAARLDSTVEEAESLIQAVYKAYPQLRVYVQSQGEYPLEHNGYINTFLGDKLRLREFYDYLPKASTEREKNNIIARIKRLGVNLPIQGGTSTVMSSGFFNNIRVSLLENWEQPLQPIITVHDSNTNLIPVEKIFDLRSFYDKNYTGYCKTIGPRITLLFDLLVGYSYETAKELKQIDKDTIEFKGDAYSLLKIYDKIMNCSKLNVQCSCTRDWLVGEQKLVDDPYYRTILENGCNMTKDLSKVTVQFHRL